MSDEKYYLQVEQELKESKRDEALWSKSMILAKDDEAEAKVQYIKARVKNLQAEAITKIVKKAAIVVLVVFGVYFVISMILISFN